jgi:hypothetical protein
VTEHDLDIFGALAETLIPEDETPGASAAWARAFVRTHLSRHAEETARFEALARHLDALAHPRSFAELAPAEREALVAAHHPSLADAEQLAGEERALRAAMRDLVAGFFLADELDIREDPLWLEGPQRDRSTPSTPDYAAADGIPDLAIDRRMATNTGRGTYGRVWRAAGYATPPGLPQPEDEIGRLPELVPLRVKR